MFQFQETSLLFLLGFQGQVKVALLLTQFLQKGKEDIWRVCLLMQGNFWVKCKNLMLIKLRGLAQPLQLTKKQHHQTQGQQWEQLLKFMTI